MAVAAGIREEDAVRMELDNLEKNARPRKEVP
jgi:hypothetical protein